MCSGNQLEQTAIELAIDHDIRFGGGIPITPEMQREHLDEFNKIFMIHERLKRGDSIAEIEDALDYAENNLQ